MLHTAYSVGCNSSYIFTKQSRARFNQRQLPKLNKAIHCGFKLCDVGTYLLTSDKRLATKLVIFQNKPLVLSTYLNSDCSCSV